MNDLRKAAEQALEALEDIFGKEKKDVGAINALRQALDDKPAVKSYCGGAPNYCTPEVTGEVTGDVDAVNMSQERVDETAKDEHEPLCYLRDDIDRPFGGFEDCDKDDSGAFPVYTAPPKREWVGLKGDEISECWKTGDVVAAVEAKLKEKNT